MLGHSQKPSDPKPIDHDGSAGTPGQFANLHNHPSPIGQKGKRPFQFVTGIKIDPQLNGMPVRIGILPGFHNGAKRLAAPMQFRMEISSILVENMIPKLQTEGRPIQRYGHRTVFYIDSNTNHVYPPGLSSLRA